MARIFGPNGNVWVPVYIMTPAMKSSPVLAAKTIDPCSRAIGSRQAGLLGQQAD